MRNLTLRLYVICFTLNFDNKIGVFGTLCYLAASVAFKQAIFTRETLRYLGLALVDDFFNFVLAFAILTLLCLMLMI